MAGQKMLFHLLIEISLNIKNIIKGKSWGKEWESAWFQLTGDIKKEWRGKQIVVDLDFSGEGLVYTPKGKEIARDNQRINMGSKFC